MPKLTLIRSNGRIVSRGRARRHRPTEPPLFSKLRRLAVASPAALGVIDLIVDRYLERIPAGGAR